MNMPLLYANEITVPVLILTGEKAHSRYFAEDAFKAVGSKDKELVVVPGLTELETRSISLIMPPRKTLDDYINNEFDPSDLAAIYNVCRLKCEVKFKNACHASGIAIKGE